jgi:hypothetical protein
MPGQREYVFTSTTFMVKAKDVVTGVFYTQNTQRALIPAGVEGPLGDEVIVSGLIYRNPDLTGAPVGTFDCLTIATSVGDITERRQVAIELAFNKRYARRSWISELRGPLKKLKQPAEVSLNGVETFPLGGGLPDGPISFGVSTGTGPFAGVEGTATITYDQESKLFTYRVNLL